MKILITTISSLFLFSEAYALVSTTHKSEASGEITNQYVAEISLDQFNKDYPQAAVSTKQTKNAMKGSLRLPQIYKGIPVYGSQLITESEKGIAKVISGRIATIPEMSIEPKVSLKKALSVADKEKDFESRLVIYPFENQVYLVWHLTEKSFDSRWNVFVDANSGKILNSFNALPTGQGYGHSGVNTTVDSSFRAVEKRFVLANTPGFARQTHDALGTKGQGAIASSSNDYWTDPAQVDAHNFAKSFLTVLKTRLNRNSYDNRGATLISTVHYGKDYVNAFWNGTQMVYGDGDGVKASNLAGAYDIIAHEITHAITHSTSDLVYQGESGALNEAFSDIIATYAEYVTQPSKFDWMIGEDVWTPGVFGDALRYMNNPSKDKKSSDYYPERYTGSEDKGGVHRNSGIANLAFYLLSQGGNHPRRGGKVIKGIGIEAATKLFYSTFTTRLTPTARFIDAKNQMIIEATKFSPQAVLSAKDAWDAVGVF